MAERAHDLRPVPGRDGTGPGGATYREAVDPPYTPAAAGRASVDNPPGPTNPTDRLITAWTAWEHAPRAAWTAAAKCDALHACGLDVLRAHEAIAAARRAGYSVPDAVQTAINDTSQEAA